jgi:hypothetical protein
LMPMIVQSIFPFLCAVGVRETLRGSNIGLAG